MLSVFFMMWIHLLAAMAWIGGMFFQWAVLRPAFKPAAGKPDAEELLKRVEDRFRTFRWLSLIALLASGVFNLIHEGASARLESAWGGVLLVKLFFAAVAVGLTGVYDFLWTPKTDGLARGRPHGFSRDSLGMAILGLGLLIVGIAVYL